MNSSAQNKTPAVGTWVIDPAVSSIGFRAKALFGMKVNGRFERFESSITVGDSAASSAVTISLGADSVTTGNKKRDEHLRSANVFAVSTFPMIEFSSTSIAETPDGVQLAGNLRVRDVMLPITLPAVRVDENRYTAEAVISPREFGITRPGTGKPLTIVIDAVLRRV